MNETGNDLLFLVFIFGFYFLALLWWSVRCHHCPEHGEANWEDMRLQEC